MILITGSSGFVGQALIRESSLTSLEVIGLDRIPKFCEMPNYRELICDLSALPKECATELSSFFGSVVHLAAARTDDADFETYKRDNIIATEGFLQSLDPSKITGFVHVSSVASIDGEELTDSGVELKKSDDYYRYTKYIQEELVSKWCERHNINCIILRPSAIFDNSFRSDTNIGRLIRIAKVLPFMPLIEVQKSLTSMTLMIKALIWSINRVTREDMKQNYCETYVVVEVPVKNVSEIVRDMTNGSVREIHIPGFKNFLVVVAFMLSIVRIFGVKVPLTKSRVDKLYRATSYNNFCGNQIWANIDE